MPPMVDPAATFSRALEIFRAHFAVLYPTALVIGLIDAIVSFALRDSPYLALTLALSLVIGSIFQGMVVELVRDVRESDAEITVGRLFRGIAPVLDKLVAVALLTAVGQVLGLVLFIVPGLILMTIWAVAAPVVVIERAGPGTALDRSRELVRGHGWQVFLVLLLVLLLTFGVALVGGLVAAGSDAIAASFVQLLLGALIAPVSALVVGVLYFRLLEIRDGEYEVPRSYADR